ncbi:MAG TPA: radical SAM protein [Thermococcus litoralis]|uniref:Radical SAM protein n=1 Tax=Thermococcus litoralis TaxID=2265 RepID=A0A7C0Y3A8_THELI|nr:MAG: radical SAM protein [Thermococci archaeon]HDD31483.1 radical SAM protein [Thermococcus litoralis]
MTKCKLCGYESEEITESIGVCVECLRKEPQKALKIARESHKKWRKLIALPIEPPKNGVRCSLCVNECEIPEEGSGYCGIVWNKGGGLIPITGSYDYAYLHWYLDPHPTNCVAGPVCPEKNHRGFYNLAVFFAGCNLDCLFCQNIEHKYMIKDGKMDPFEGIIMSSRELADIAMRSKVSCVCYFGGDPTPHSPYAIKTSREILKRAEKVKSIKRICWETNGLENPNIIREMARLSLESGGIIKIDWKAYTPSVYEALTGINGEKALQRIKENIRVISSMDERKEPPLLVVSTLVVPHYIDEEEVRGIARYLSRINPYIPYILLAFAPQHLMHDVPTTSKRQMERVCTIARKEGLKRVFIGNFWLLR